MLNHKSSLAAAIENRRMALGITQDDAAERAAVSSRTILDFENGRGNPRLETLFSVVRALELDANDIFYPETRIGTSPQIRLHAVFAECSDSEAEMLYEICSAVLSSLRKRESANVE